MLQVRARKGEGAKQGDRMAGSWLVLFYLIKLPSYLHIFTFSKSTSYPEAINIP